MSEAKHPNRDELGLTKYREVLICEGCKAVYIDGDGCPNHCLECEVCKIMTELADLDPTLLMEAHAEICHDCADDFIDELYERSMKSESPATKKPIMGDHKGRV